MDRKEIVKYFYEVVVTNHLIAVKNTYPDYSMKIIRQYCDGDYVISEFIMEGTHKGEWLGMKPTNKKLAFTGVDIDKVTDGKIVEHGGAVKPQPCPLRGASFRGSHGMRYLRGYRCACRLWIVGYSATYQ